jgi:hypothetical protein
VLNPAWMEPRDPLMDGGIDDRWRDTHEVAARLIARDELLLDHHIEEILVSISALPGSLTLVTGDAD